MIDIKTPLEAIRDELCELDELSSSLTTFIAGCETGGNKAGADFARTLKLKLNVSVNGARRSVDAVERLAESVQDTLTGAELMQVKAEETIKATQAKMDKLKRTMDGARAAR